MEFYSVRIPCSSSFGREKENQGTCGHYGKSGHEIKACYQITRLLSIQNGGEKALEVPKKRQLRGREMRQVPKKRQVSRMVGICGGARAHATRVPQENHPNTDRPGLPTLNKDQWATLLIETINQNKGGVDRMSDKGISFK